MTLSYQPFASADTREVGAKYELRSAAALDGRAAKKQAKRLQLAESFLGFEGSASKRGCKRAVPCFGVTHRFLVPGKDQTIGKFAANQDTKKAEAKECRCAQADRKPNIAAGASKWRGSVVEVGHN